MSTKSDDRAPPRRGLGCLLLVMMALAMFGAFGLLLSFGEAGGSDGRIYEEVESSPQGARRTLAIIDLRGAILGDGPGGKAHEVIAMLERARDDDAVAGVLLAIDSPGGSVTDSDLVHRAVKKLRERDKPVVVLMGDLCASGGYYVAVAASAVYAMPTTVTGSIGVIIFGLNAHEMLAKMGIADVSIKSGDFKDMLSPTKPMDEEDRRLLQDIVDSMHGRFVELVAQGRSLPPEDVRALADGRLYTAEQAKARRLIDEIGYEEDALDRLRSLAQGGPFRVVRYRREPTLFEVLRAAQGPPAMPGAALLERLGDGPRAMYLYSPLGLAH